MTIRFAVFFDMDGTLLQTEKLATPAFLRTFEDLKAKKLWNGPIPSEQELTNVLGMTLDQLWETLLPNADHEVKHEANRFMLEHESQLLKEGVTDLYPRVRHVLQELKSNGAELFVASNGLESYIDEVCSYFELKPLFTDLYSAGRFRTKSKIDLVKKLVADYQIEQAVMVGDRHSDIEAGRSNGLKTIGCDFGFATPGELDQADVIIKNFEDILHHIQIPKK
ncbi:HAD-IA family hydrolase [Brevibacillus ginsengisoli]|uniref:HAD-IA family hydrolase n=1 Tax=Brevibacillus ginsengisoli TaxID=363854 RepID=UPI003CEB1DB3